MPHGEVRGFLPQGGVDLGEGELAGVGVVFVELAVAAPVDGDVELAFGLFVGEAAAEDVEEEAFARGCRRGWRRARC